MKFTVAELLWAGKDVWTFDSKLSAQTKRDEDALTIAEQAEEMAVDSAQKVKYLVKLLRRQ